MALPILDGNQTATTLSSVVTGGEHIVAHSVVSLGPTAISNITSAVSGIPISGTVTANVIGLNYSNGQAPVQLPIKEDFDGTPFVMVGPSTTPEPFLISGTVTVGNSVTIGSLPAISGTVTANIGNPSEFIGDGNNTLHSLFEQGSLVVGAMPAISGTVTANNPNGALTTRFGSVTTANTAQITSAVTNTSRKYLLAQNISAGTVTIGIGFSPTTTQGIQLTAGGGLTFDAFCPTGAVYWLGAVTGAAFAILEG